MNTTAGTAWRATLRKAVDNSRAVDVAGVCACVPAGRNNAQASSQTLRMISLLSLALTWFWTLRLCSIVYSFLLSLMWSELLKVFLQEQRTGEKPGAEEHELSVLADTYVVLDAAAV
jgi:hypothetical protein